MSCSGKHFLQPLTGPFSYSQEKHLKDEVYSPVAHKEKGRENSIVLQAERARDVEEGG